MKRLEVMNNIYVITPVIIAWITIGLFRKYVDASYDRFGGVVRLISLLLVAIGCGVALLLTQIISDPVITAIGIYLLVLGATTGKIFNSRAARESTERHSINDDKASSPKP